MSKDTVRPSGKATSQRKPANSSYPMPRTLLIDWMLRLTKATDYKLADPGLDDPYTGLLIVDKVVEEMTSFLYGGRKL